MINKTKLEKNTKDRAGSTGTEDDIIKTVSNIHTTEQETETKVIQYQKFRQTHTDWSSNWTSVGMYKNIHH